MFLEVDEGLISEFEALLLAPKTPGRQREQEVQDFLELHSELLPTPVLLNHGLSMKAVISKYPLSKALTTDYVYLTKSSGRWIIHMVELEQPEKPIFTGGMDTPTYSAPFNAALAQVNSWKRYVAEHKAEVLKNLGLLMVPRAMSEHPVRFEFHLIIGRSQEKNLSLARKEQFEQTREDLKINIFTYDSLIQQYRTGQRFKKNIMYASKDRFGFSSLIESPRGIFSYVGPDVIDISSEQEAALNRAGYQMEEWKKGKMLTVSDKLPMDSAQERLSIFSRLSRGNRTSD